MSVLHTCRWWTEEDPGMPWVCEHDYQAIGPITHYQETTDALLAKIGVGWVDGTASVAEPASTRRNE